jgi:molybdopterin-synthase adenylyltransferase
MLRSRRYPDDEALGFLLCDKVRLRSEDRYVVKEWLVPRSDECVAQSSGGVSLSSTAHRALLDRLLQSGLSPVHLHTHPGDGIPRFSGIDDHYEASYAKALDRLPSRPNLLSGVYNYSMTQARFRAWSAGGSEELNVQRSWLRPRPASEDTVGQAQISELFARQKVFGEAASRDMESIVIGLVGAGGLGAIFAEYLARLGVRRWILVDPDHLERTNLNRAPFATSQMARENVAKVEHVRQLIERFWASKASIRCIVGAIPDDRSTLALKRADIIVVATDNHQSRLDAIKFALKIGKPLLSIGSYIEKSDPDIPPRIFGRVTLAPLSGGWCLACCGAISLQQAAIEQADPVTSERLHQAGYIAGVNAPAVYWVNGATAGIAAGVIHGMIAGFGVSPEGLDHVINYTRGTWLNLEHDIDYNCYICGIGETVGLTDAARTRGDAWS